MNTPLTWMETSPDTHYWIIEKDTPTEPTLVYLYVTNIENAMIAVQFVGTDHVRHINQMKDFLFLEIEKPTAIDFFPGDKAILRKVIQKKKTDAKARRA